MNKERGDRGTQTIVLLVALLASSVPAGAQQFQCTANAGVPARVRGEGRTELLGDFLLNCAGAVPSAITGNVQIFLSTNVTSRIVDTGTNATEALLTLDDPLPASQVIGTNVFRGVVAGNNSLVWTNIPIAPAGAFVTRVIRITNVRANANQAFSPGQLIPPQVTMFVVISSSTQIPLANPTQVVGAVLTGLGDFALRNCADSDTASLTFSQCVSVGQTDPAATNHILQGLLKFSEGFDAAFKSRLAPGQDGALLGTWFASESGYVNTARLGPSTGTADTGTRLIARFANVPTGVSIFVTTAPTTNGTTPGVTAVLVSTTDLTGTGGSASLPIPATGRHTGACSNSGGSNGIAQVPTVGGVGAATWEILNTSSISLESVAFGLEAAYTANPLSNLPALGTANVHASFAPISAISNMSSTAAVPRFADIPILKNAFRVSSCSGDFDGNGHPEVIWQSDSTGQAAVWFMGGADGLTVQGFGWLHATGALPWRVVGTADFDGNGKPDIIWQNETTRQASVWFMGGSDGLTVQSMGWLHGTGAPGWRIVGTADFDGNGKPDVTWQEDSTRKVAVWFMGGADGLTVQGFGWLHASGAAGWRVAGTGDFDGNGKPDVIWQNDSTRQVSVWFMGGSDGLTVQGFGWLHATGAPGWSVVGAADFNGDGKPDVVWQNDTTRQASVWFMGGSQGLTVQSFGWLHGTGAPGWKVLPAK